MTLFGAIIGFVILVLAFVVLVLFRAFGVLAVAAAFVVLMTFGFALALVVAFRFALGFVRLFLVVLHQHHGAVRGVQAWDGRCSLDRRDKPRAGHRNR